MPTDADRDRSTAPAAEKGRWTSTNADWEGVKDTIVELYWEQDKRLPEVMDAMATGHNFHATEKQYKYRLDKWKLEKNVSQTKMSAVSRIRNKRLLDEHKDTEFSHRGRPIAPEKIDRWEKRNAPPEGQALSPSESIAASTPSGITYQTPRSLVSTPFPQDPISPGEPMSPQHAGEDDSRHPLQWPVVPIPGNLSPPPASRSLSRSLTFDFPQHHYVDYGPYNQARSAPSPPGVNSYVHGNHSVPPPPPQSTQHYGYEARFAFQYSQCTGRRKALLIGINYFNQRGQLRGCINDVRNMSAYLIENFGYRREDMVILTDDQQNPMSQPTKQNILRAMHWLVKNACPNDSLFFHYSGHGGQTKDLDGDSEDGYDEVIYPVDFRQKGHITDDEMHRIMVRPLQAGVRLTAIFDSCHSGTALDLPYIYSTQGILKEPNLAKEAGQGLLGVVSAYSRGDLDGVANNIMGFFKKARTSEDASARTSEDADARTSEDAYARSMAVKTSPADVIMFSGSKDDQTSADATIASQATGAMSWAFITSLKKNPKQSFVQLLNSMRDELMTRYTQKPQLSCSHPLDTDIMFKM